jgi:SAM-dependent methyltransferase
LLPRWLTRKPRRPTKQGLLRDLPAWNTKVLGALLARQCYQAGLAGPEVVPPLAPERLDLAGCLCRQADIESPWLHHWCGQLRTVPYYHRKVWEDCFVLQALWEAGMMAPGQRGLGFAVGQEPIPAFMAARGASIVATDLAAGDRRAQPWAETGQHGTATLFKPELISRADFDARVTTRAVDMARIPRDLRGGFDFLWSVCALEHLGSIEAGGRFILDSLRCLKPGGIAVHTTEFDLDPEGPPLDRGGTVLFQQHHIEELSDRLSRAGHRLLPVDFDPGEGLLDRFIDHPPYGPQDRWPLPLIPETPHLRLMNTGRIATSVGLIIRAGG